MTSYTKCFEAALKHCGDPGVEARGSQWQWWRRTLGTWRHFIHNSYLDLTTLIRNAAHRFTLTMPYFPVRVHMEQPQSSEAMELCNDSPSSHQQQEESERTKRIRIKNRRKRYLDTHPSYFNPSLELADPLLYDRLIRRFQSPSEREAEGRAKGYSGILEADIMRSEAKLEALAHPDPNSTLTYRRGPNGEIMAEEKDEMPLSKEQGMEWWQHEMGMRFLRGDDTDFDYKEVDENEDLDDLEEQERQEAYFEDEEPTWAFDDGERELTGETGIQDF